MEEEELELRFKEEEINREINAMANKIQKIQIYSNKKTREF